jgi:hypothetical protein
MSGPQNPHQPSISVFVLDDGEKFFALRWQIIFGNLSILEIFIRGFRDLQSFHFREGHSEPRPTGAP